MSDIKTVAVIGAGDMGHGIAEVALIAGYKVTLQDIKDEFVERGVGRIVDSLEKLVEKGRVPPEHVDTIKAGLLTPEVDLRQAVKDADLVIEAIPEIMDVKKRTFAVMDEAAPPHAILASNTSTMKISEIAAVTERPDRVVGMHYFNPAVLMKLVEVIRGERTSEETMAACCDFIIRNNKTPVKVLKDVPGFIVNRVQAPGGVLLNCILDEGVERPEAVDALFRKLGMPMGPYEIMDFTGLDIAVAGGRYFAHAVHPDYAPGKTIVDLVETGHLGKKSGRGIFDWHQGRPSIDPASATETVDVMDIVAVNANEAMKLIEMGVCSAEDIDIAVTNGTGSAAGPMAMVKDRDPAALTARLENLAARFGKEIFRPTAMVINGGYRL